MTTNPEVELAQLALVGQRYTEAEEKFTRLLSTPDAAQAWLGIGLAKFGKLPSRKCTPDEVAFCFNKFFAMAPERKAEAYGLLVSAAQAMLEEAESMIPDISAAEAEAKKAATSALLHKGFAYLRAGNSETNSHPTLFTNVDALHHSFRGSVLLDASAEMRANAQAMKNYLLTAVRNIRDTVTKIVPQDQLQPSWAASCSVLIAKITIGSQDLSQVDASGNLVPKPYYRSSDQKMLLGICAGFADRWKLNRFTVRGLFLVLTCMYGIGIYWYVIAFFIVKEKRPTKKV